MKKIFYIFIFYSFFFSCKEKDKESLYSVRADIRLGTKFYSICLNEKGDANVIKGNGSDYTGTLKIISADTSDVFKLDSSKLFFENLNRIKTNHILGANRSGAPRVEVYYNHKKVYDTYRWDETFWDLFRPIMGQLPKGFSPFRPDDKPFEWD